MNDGGEVCSEEAGDDGTLEHPTAGLGDSEEVFIVCHLVEKKGGDEGKYSSNDNSHSKPKQPINEESNHMIVTKNMDLSWQAAHNFSHGNSVRGNARDSSNGKSNGMVATPDRQI